MSESSIHFSLGTDNSALHTGLHEAKEAVHHFKEEVHETLMGIFAGVGIEQLISQFAKIGEMAEMFGTTAEAVQRVKAAADQSGTSIETVGRLMAKLRADGGGALEKLGIDAKEFAHSGMDEQILMISEHLEKIPDPQQRINTALEVFGVRGREILPMLSKGYETLKEEMHAASVASNETVESLRLAEDRLKSMSNTAKVFGAEILTFFYKAIQSIGTFIGVEIATVTAAAGGIADTFADIFRGDFKGAMRNAQTLGEKIGAQIGMGIREMGTIWSPEGGEHGHGGGSDLWKEEIEKTEEKKKQLTLAERIATLEKEAAQKALSTADQLDAVHRHLAAQQNNLADEDDPEKRKEIEDAILKNTHERLSLEAKARAEEAAHQKELENEKKAYDKEVERERVKGYAIAMEVAKKEAHERSKAEKEAQKEAHAQMMASFSERQKDLGFVSGIKGQTDGQQLAGVNYSVINGESEKAIKLQEEMRDYLRSIDEKKWTVELPDAS